MAENERNHKKKKKIFKKLNNKQKLGLGATSIIAIAAIISGVYFYYELQENPEHIFICGLDTAPNAIDPFINPEPRYTNLIILDQIAEGLFGYDQNKTDTPVVPNLALDGNWSSDHLNFTCILRQNVTFHDKTPFNAAAVKWNIDRLYRFSESMAYNQIWAWNYSYHNSEGIRYINRTVVIDDYIIRFVLNQPYVPIKDLLALWQSYILSPTSTPENEPVSKWTDKLVGTGPFIFDSCQVNSKGDITKIDMSANPDYWGGKPSINKVTFLAIKDNFERMERMLSGELSYAMGVRDDTILDIYRNTPGITVLQKPSSSFFYLSMNNQKINVTMRKAISYAFNYSHYIEEFWGVHAERARSPIPKKMCYSKWDDFDVPYYNVSTARQILKDMSWPGTINLTVNDNITDGNEWETKTNSIPLATYNYSYYYWAQEFAGNCVVEDLKQIGVKVNLIELSPVDFFDKLYKGELEFFFNGWGAAMLDPVEIINPLYSSKLDGKEGNHIHFNDTEVQQWMENALQEFNDTAREHLYFDIQQKLIEQLNPVVWLVAPYRYDIWDSKVAGIAIEGVQLKFILKNIYLT